MASSPQHDDCIAGRYRLMRRLQSDEATVLWEANDEEEMQLVQLRLLRDALRDVPLVVMRFRREAAIGQRLDHPAIAVPCRQVDDARTPALVYDRPGTLTLADRLREGPVPPSEAIHLLEPVFDALSHAHRRGVVHRNLSPRHIWLDDGGQVRLGGFGGAKVLDMVGLTTHSTAFGVSHYRAPEQLEGTHADRRTDIWALGVILLEMLTGTAPFSAAGPRLLRRQQAELDVGEQLGEMADTPIGDAIATALRVDRRHRFGSVGEMAGALTERSTLPAHDHERIACWRCDHPRDPGLNFCIRCGAGPLLENPGDGKFQLVVPKLRTGRESDGSRRYRGIRGFPDLFYRSYLPGLDADEKALLLRRLKRAGIRVDDAARKRMNTSPFRIAVDLTEEDAHRLQTFLADGEARELRDEPESEREATPALEVRPSSHDFPYTHVRGDVSVIQTRHGKWPPIFYSLAGIRWSSPILALGLTLIAVSSMGLFLTMALLLLFAFGVIYQLIYLGVAAIVLIPVWIAMGIRSQRNREPIATDLDHTDKELFPTRRRYRWQQLVAELSNDDDRRLVEELLAAADTCVRDAKLQRQLSWVRPALDYTLRQAEETTQVLTEAPRPDEWQRLQLAWEKLHARRREEGDTPELREQHRQLFDQMQRHEIAAERAEFARAQLLRQIERIRSTHPTGDGHSGKESAEPPPDASALEQQLEDLRQIHRVFADIEGVVNFSDIEPAEQRVQLDIELPQRFDVTRRIGRGGMASAVVAWDHFREEEVVLKIPHRDLRSRPATHRLMRREFEAAQRVHHPGMVAVYEQLDIDGCPVLVMEHAEGVDLQSMVRWRGALPVGEVRDIAGKLLDALEAAHRAGVVHGDVKPSNVIVAPDGSVKLIDFGLARVDYVAGNDEMSARVGTPRYAPPELRDDGVVDERADIYGAGVTLLEVLVGQPPNGNQGHIAGELFEELEAGLQLKEVLRRATSERPDHRFTSAKQMKRAVVGDEDSTSVAEQTSKSCSGCGEPLISGLQCCFRCGHRRHALRRSLQSGARRVVVQSGHDGKTFGEDDVAAVNEVLNLFSGLHRRQNFEQALSQPPVILTPALVEEDAQTIAEELTSRGLGTRVMGAWLASPAYKLWKSVPRMLAGTVPLLALVPVYFVLGLIWLEMGFPSDPPQSTFELAIYAGLIALILLPFGAALGELWGTLRPATRIFDEPSHDDLTDASLPWEAAAAELSCTTEAERPRRILTGLAAAAARLRHRWTADDFFEELIPRLDRLMGTAVDHAEQLLDAEQSKQAIDVDEMTDRLRRLEDRLEDASDDEAETIRTAIEQTEQQLQRWDTARRRVIRLSSALLKLTRKLRQLHEQTPVFEETAEDEEWTLPNIDELQTVFEFHRAPAEHPESVVTEQPACQS